MHFPRGPPHLLHPAIKALRGEVLQFFVGDYINREAALVMCDGSCGGDPQLCKKLNVAKAQALCERLLFHTILPIPVETRWWKMKPALKRFFMGLAFHGLFAAAPKDFKKSRHLHLGAAEDDVDRAAACAVAMQRAMADVNARNRAEGLPALSMGIGIHTGEAVVGNIGTA